MHIKEDEWAIPFIIDHEQMRELHSILQRRKMGLGGLPSALRKQEKTWAGMIAECVMCATKQETFAHPYIDLCLNCYRNNVINDYNKKACVVLYSHCFKCGSLFNSGVRVFNIRVCTKCMQRIKGIEVYKKLLR